NWRRANTGISCQRLAWFLPSHALRLRPFKISRAKAMIPLEDNAIDIVQKAQRGLGLSDAALAESAGISRELIGKLRQGDLDEQVLLRIAPALGLDGRALCEIASGRWRPEKIECDGLGQFNTRYHDMAVNAYLVWDPAERAAATFDTGADCAQMLRFANRRGLTVKLILLTHAHADHVADLARLREETGASVMLPRANRYPAQNPSRKAENFVSQIWK